MSDDTKHSQSQIDLRDKATEEATDGNGPKTARFYNGDNDPAIIKKRERDARNFHLTAFQTQFADQARVEQCWNTLNDVQTKLDKALLENVERLDELKAGAAKLENGSPVFYDASNGRFYRADDTLVPRDQEPTDIPENPTTRQDYQAEKQRGATLADIQTDTLDTVRITLQEGDVTNGQAEDIEGQLREAESQIDRKASSDAAPAIAETQSKQTIAMTLDTAASAPSI